MIRRYPSVFLLVFVIAGIVTADQTAAPAWIFLLAAVAAWVLGLAALARSAVMPAAVAFAIGIGMFSASHFAQRYVETGPHHLARILTESASYRVYGRVADWPDLRDDRTEIVIALDSLASDRIRRVEGNLLLKVSDTTTALQRGDHVEFTGYIIPVAARRAADRFDYHHYLNLKGVYGVVYLSSVLDIRVRQSGPYGVRHAVDWLRNRITSSLKRNLAPIQAALAGGFLIGETRGIPKTVYNMFRDSGTLHLLAVSGSNVALVLLFTAGVLRPFKLSRTKRYLLLLLCIIVFAELSYEEPSVIRASVMAGLVIIAGLMQRRYDLNNIIAAAAVIILLVNPAQLYDVGFQLSFVTAWCLIFAVPRVLQTVTAYQRRWWYRWLAFPFLVSLVAQLASAPVIAFHFGRIPAISVLANLVIVPLVSLAVIAILVMLLTDLIWPLAGLAVGSLVNDLLAAVVWCLQLMGGENMPVITTGRWLTGPVGIWMVLLAYGVLLAGVLSLRRRPARKYVVVGMLLICSLFLVQRHLELNAQANTTVELRSVPGGVAGLIDHSGDIPPDLVLTGLRRRDYQIDETILQPWLEVRGVTRLGRVFLLSSDYGALDDVLRLGAVGCADSILIADHLRHAVADVFTFGPNLPDSLPTVVFLRPAKTGRSAPGYYADGSGLVADFGRLSVTFADRLPENPAQPAGDSGRHVLVVGETWRNSPPGPGISARHYDHVIWSRIAQPSHASGDDTGLALSPIPKMSDLAVSGVIRVYLTRDGEVLIR